MYYNIEGKSTSGADVITDLKDTNREIVDMLEGEDVDKAKLEKLYQRQLMQSLFLQQLPLMIR